MQAMVSGRVSQTGQARRVEIMRRGCPTVEEERTLKAKETEDTSWIRRGQNRGSLPWQKQLIQRKEALKANEPVLRFVAWALS